MELAGQPFDFAHGRGNRGYAMAALLVGMSVMAVLMGALLPVWTTMAKREKEAELVFRGNQYARAIGLFQRKFANTPPPTIDVLVEQRFLRKKYKDPITNDDFQPLYANQAMTPIGPGGQQQQGQQRGTPARARRTAHSTRLRRHWRDRGRRHHRRDLEEQGHVAEGLQRTHQVQRVGVRSRSDVPAAGAAGRRRAAGRAGRKSAWRPGRAAARPFTVWHATGFINPNPNQRQGMPPQPPGLGLGRRCPARAAVRPLEHLRARRSVLNRSHVRRGSALQVSNNRVVQRAADLRIPRCCRETDARDSTGSRRTGLSPDRSRVMSR